MKVSVIMPTYNRAEMLRGAIQSFLEQDYDNAELIILDNGSTDNTSQVLNEFLPHPKIWVVLRLDNLTPPHNFNKLLEFVDGDLICHLHDDDRLTKDSLSLRVKHFEKNPELDVVFAGWITDGKVYPGAKPDADRIEKEEYINFLTMMFRSNVDMFMDTDLRYYHDWLLKIKCFREYTVGSIPEPVIDYTVHPGQASIECRKLGMNGPEERLMREKLSAAENMLRLHLQIPSDYDIPDTTCEKVSAQAILKLMYKYSAHVLRQEREKKK